LNYYRNSGANPNIYVALCGRFTPKQKELAEERASVIIKTPHLVRDKVRTQGIQKRDAARSVPGANHHRGSSK